MPTVLITAFEPYDQWSENSSWLALVELTRELPAAPKIVTRRYPVDFDLVRKRLADDLSANYDLVLHLGQSPRIGRIHLEQFGLNVGGASNQSPDDFRPLIAGGPAAYRSALPLQAWSAAIRALGIPCQVSHHAGTYLCNAVLYLSHHIAAERGLKTKVGFVHLPLAPQQVLRDRHDLASMSSFECGRALQCMLAQFLAEHDRGSKPLA